MRKSRAYLRFRGVSFLVECCIGLDTITNTHLKANIYETTHYHSA